MDSTSSTKKMWKPIAAAFVCGMGILPALTLPAYLRDVKRARELQMSLGSQVINTACGPIEYATAGSGQPVLVVHGVVGGYDQGIAYGQTHLGAGFRLIAPSRFGYQRTPMPKDASPAAQADALACLLDALQIPTVSVLGISAGAPSSLQLALRHPQRVQALLLDVPLAYSPQRATDGQSVTFPFVLSSILKWDYPLWAAMKLDRSIVLSTMGVPIPVQKQLTKAKQVELMSSMLPFASRIPGVMNDGKIASNMQPFPLQSITTPTLVLSARDDLWRTWPGAEYTAANIPNSRFVGFETGGHMHNGEEERLKTEIATFLTAHGRPVVDAIGSQHS